MTVWVLAEDPSALLDSDQVRADDYVVRPTGDRVQVGVARPKGDEPVLWETEVDLALLPTEDLDLILERADHPTPFQRVEDAEELETALEGILSAARQRGA